MSEPLTPRRIGRAIWFCRLFHAASPWKHTPFDMDAMEALIARLGESEEGYVDVREDGLILGTLHRLPWSPETVLGVELVWWSEGRGAGRSLREGFEAWAKEKGAQWIQASALCDANEPRVRALYDRAGYEAAEIAFRKRL